MTEKEYRTHPAISRSELWRMNESPEKFLYFKNNPPAATPALLFGQVVHKMVLLPEDFDTDFVIAPDIDRRTKAGKEDYAAFIDSVGDRAVVSRQDVERAAAMIQALEQNKTAMELLTGRREVPYFWTDADTGEDCKCRVDCLTMRDGALAIVDYKSATDARTDVFNNVVFKLGYYFQSAFYSEGVMRATGLTERPDFIFIVQEKTPPYAVNIVQVSEEVMLAGVDKFRELLGRYHECKTTGYYYGYTGPFGDLNETYLPGYMTLGVEDDDE